MPSRRLALAWLAMVLALGCTGPNAVPPVDPCANLPPSEPPPAPRSGAAGGFDFINTFVVFGGDTNASCNGPEQPSDDTWIFDIECKRWTQITGAKPPARSGAAYALETLSTRKRLIVIGGRGLDDSGNYQLLNDVWAFDLLANSWAQLDISTATPPPPPRADAMAAFDGGRDLIILYGGSSLADPTVVAPLGDLWSLNLGTRTWLPLSSGNTAPPPPRALGVAVIDFFSAPRMLYVGFGTASSPTQGPFLDDFYGFDLENQKWITKGAQDGGPSGRVSPSLSFEIDKGLVTLFGGFDNGPLGYQNDVWSIDPLKLATAKWVLSQPGDTPTSSSGSVCERPADFASIPVTDLPPPERRAGALFSYAGSSVFYTFGGRGDCGSMNDVWGLLEARGWGPLSRQSAGQSCARAGRTGCQSLCQ